MDAALEESDHEREGLVDLRSGNALNFSLGDLFEFVKPLRAFSFAAGFKPFQKLIFESFEGVGFNVSTNLTHELK